MTKMLKLIKENKRESNGEIEEIKKIRQAIIFEFSRKLVSLYLTNLSKICRAHLIT